MNQVYWVYILKSLKDQKYYIGQTNNLEHRLAQHNSGKVRATKHRTPFVLVYKEKCYSTEEAIKREKFLKTHKGYNYLKRLGFY
ncbi:excinuclease ABC subunit C [Candidatus Shapirobacteria bacterium CG10_big_fil_rev_8_21_14_0_10_40_9]|uniref:Excinuclease ABC subunit C n=1 Tax=Candidatus Shapirobacteria bacterium CG10_big_fil_rev_8_21_14_0_10_40_9 TaxID=1974888 RepID=A0A2M8L4H7_9BACT|nr:MAG: excinuclease ABC subunit C [Candidatus Shapirobacteria bacterium CG10_big_fil_rev_8_21_14_0_10_40_9]